MGGYRIHNSGLELGGFSHLSGIMITLNGRPLTEAAMFWADRSHATGFASGSPGSLCVSEARTPRGRCENVFSRRPSHFVCRAPVASRPLLERVLSADRSCLSDKRYVYTVISSSATSASVPVLKDFSHSSKPSMTLCIVL